MAGFGDIAPAVEIVNIRGASIKMGALSYDDLVDLGRMYKEAAKAIDESASIFDLLTKFPEAISSVLAMGFGQKGNKETEAQAARLSIGDQHVLLEACLKATFAEGYGPFVRMMKAVGWADVERSMEELTGSWSRSSSSMESNSLKPAA